MSPARPHCCAALVLMLLCAQALLAAAQATPPAAAAACPLTDFSRVDFNSAKPACSLAQANAPAPGFCDACICTLGQRLVTGLEAAGIQVDGQPISSLTTAPTNGTDSGGGIAALLDACAPVLGLQLLQSGALTSAALAELTKCDARAAGRTCYEAAVKTENGGAAAPRVLVTDSAPAPTPAAPARSSASAATFLASLAGAAPVLLAAVML